MKVSDEVASGANVLLHSVDILVCSLSEAAADTSYQYQGIEEAFDVTQRYRNFLADGILRADPAAILKAANLMTTLNRGIADTVSLEAYPEVGRQAAAIYSLALSIRRILD